MITYAPFKAEHAFRLKLQPAQQWMEEYLPKTHWPLLENDFACTVLLDGQPILCGGAVPEWNERAIIWALVDERANAKVFRELHTLVKSFLRNLPFRRVEAYVDIDFEAGHRWVKALGFKREDKDGMESFQVNGGTCALYARIKR